MELGENQKRRTACASGYLMHDFKTFSHNSYMRNGHARGL
jgi:hypothetical protein